jgi:hypothetical protein
MAETTSCRRFASGTSRASPRATCSSGKHAVIVVAHPSEMGGPDWPSETATVMQFRNERFVSMQDYRTEAEAIAAVEQR